MRAKSATPRTRTSATHVLRLLKALKGHTLTGISNKQLTARLGIDSSLVSIALNTLESEGLAVQLENGRYAHSIEMLQIAQAHTEHTMRMQDRINDINTRIAAGVLS